ncbi:MAG: MFS transporter, partial [Burkholderiales bacterium]
AVLRDRWVRTVLVTVSLEGALFYGAFAYTGAYLKMRFDLPYLTVGVILAGFGLGGLVYSILVRWLLQRLGESGLVTGGAPILLSCFLLLPLLPIWQMTILLFIAAGLGFYMFHNTLQTRATEMAPQSRGTAVAVFAFSLFLGQAVGVAVCGAAIDLVGYGWMFALVGGLMLLLGLGFANRIAAQPRAI